MAQLNVGTRVDCLFDGLEYYRGAVSSCNVDGTLGIQFDDGDVLEAAPASHVLVPLSIGSRVDCWFESAGECFPGGIAADNGDATYQVHFDDGDELAAAPRRDIKLIAGAVSCSAPSPVRISNQLDSLCDGLQGFSAAATESPIVQHASAKAYSTADDSETDAAAPYEDDAFERIVQAQTVTGTQRAKRAFGKLARSKEAAPSSNITAAAGESSADVPTAGGTASSAEHPQAAIAAAAAAVEAECLVYDCDPGVCNALYSHLEALRHGPDQLALAPPDYRLFVLLTQSAGTDHSSSHEYSSTLPLVVHACTCQAHALEQQCEAQIARGETGSAAVASLTALQQSHTAVAAAVPVRSSGPMSPEPYQRFINYTAAAATAAATAAVPAVGAEASDNSQGVAARAQRTVEALTKLRMRQVALVRLCYGDTSIEMAQALCSLATCYAEQELWPQVSDHMSRAGQILTIARNKLQAAAASITTAASVTTSSLVFATADRYSSAAVVAALKPAGCASVLLLLLRTLRQLAAASQHGLIQRDDVQQALLDHSRVAADVVQELLDGFPDSLLEGVHCMEALVQARAAFTTVTATAAAATAASTTAAAAGADLVPLSVLTSALTSAACSVRSRRLDECCPRLCEELAAQCSIDSSDSSGSNNVPVAWEEVAALMTVHAGVGGRSSTKADRAWLASLKVP
eukprot:12249-Heterococcus_DN1.PRE.2